MGDKAQASWRFGYRCGCSACLREREGEIEAKGQGGVRGRT